jgi:hypothetical protein
VGRCVRHVAQASVVAVLLAIFAATPAQATPIVAATVTPGGTLFHYAYAITFDPLDDEVALFTINVLPNDLTLVNRLAPAGFTTQYDPGLGLITFLPDLLGTFPLSGTLAGFSFDSAHTPRATTFVATSIFGDELIGPTAGPLGDVVPEPATWVLLAIGMGALAGRRVIRRPIRSRD